MVPPLTRADLEVWCRDDASQAAAQFLGVLHDVTFHHGDDLFAFHELYGYDAAVKEALYVIDRVKNAAAEAEAQIRAGQDRIAWLRSGAPLRCGSCACPIEPDYEEWRVCGGWAEHENCHSDDPAAEEPHRSATVREDEYQAYLDERTRTGPRPGDRVQLTYGDGTAVEGTWELRGGAAVVRLDDDSLYEVTGQVTTEVVELNEDWQ
jgi:hypothetical protein